MKNIKIIAIDLFAGGVLIKMKERVRYKTA